MGISASSQPHFFQPLQLTVLDLVRDAPRPEVIVIIQYGVQEPDPRPVVCLLSESDVITVRHLRESRISDKAPPPCLVPDRDVQVPGKLPGRACMPENEVEGQHIEVAVRLDRVCDRLEGGVLVPPIVIIHEQHPAARRFVEALVPGLPAIVPPDLEHFVRVFPGNLRRVVLTIIAHDDQFPVCERLPPDGIKSPPDPGRRIVCRHNYAEKWLNHPSSLPSVPRQHRTIPREQGNNQP